MFSVEDYRNAFHVDEESEKDYTVADMRNQFVAFNEQVANAVSEFNTLTDKLKANEAYIAKLEERNRYLFNHQTIVEQESKEDKEKDKDKDKDKSINDVAMLYA